MKKPSEKIIAHYLKLFNVKDQYDPAFVEWSETLGDDIEMNFRSDELFDSGKFDEYDDPEYEAAWAATAELLSDEEALKSFNEIKENY